MVNGIILYAPDVYGTPEIEFTFSGAAPNCLDTGTMLWIDVMLRLILTLI